MDHTSTSPLIVHRLHACITLIALMTTDGLRLPRARGHVKPHRSCHTLVASRSPDQIVTGYPQVSFLLLQCCKRFICTTSLLHTYPAAPPMHAYPTTTTGYINPTCPETSVPNAASTLSWSQQQMPSFSGSTLPRIQPLHPQPIILSTPSSSFATSGPGIRSPST